MIEYALLIMLGFCAAGLLAMLFAPSLWNRAVRLTTKRLEATMPMSLSDIEADKDLLRAAYAIQIRRLQAALNGMRDKSAGQLVEISKLQMMIGELKDRIGELDKQLDERRNAANVYESTIRKRFPELEGSLATARAALEDRAYEIEDLQSKLGRRDEALAMAQRSARLQQNEITLLRETLEKSGTDRSGRFKARPTQWSLEDYRAEYDRLNLEMSRMREQLALSYEREKSQNAMLRAELQQLGEKVMTTLTLQQKQAAASRSVEKPGKTDAPHRRDVPERRAAAPRPWLNERSSGASVNQQEGMNTLTAEQRKKASQAEPAPQAAFKPRANNFLPSLRKDDAPTPQADTPPELQALFDRTVKVTTKAENGRIDRKAEPSTAEVNAMQGAVSVELAHKPDLEDVPLPQAERSVAEALAAARNSETSRQEASSISPALDRVVKEMFEGDGGAANVSDAGQAADALTSNAEVTLEPPASPAIASDNAEDQQPVDDGASEDSGTNGEKKDTLLGRLRVMQERQTG